MPATLTQTTTNTQNDMTSIRIYNTLTGEKEPFEPVTPGKAGIYLCGPTVYKEAHIGHLVGPIVFDTIKRFLTQLRIRGQLDRQPNRRRRQTHPAIARTWNLDVADCYRDDNGLLRKPAGGRRGSDHCFAPCYGSHGRYHLDDRRSGRERFRLRSRW